MTTKDIPVTESTLSAADVGRMLQQIYVLNGAVACRLFRTGINHLYIVSDTDSKFVFRVYTFNWRTKLEISEEIRLLNHLRINDVPVAYPIADKDGNFIQALHAPEGTRYGVLFIYANGKKIPQFTTEASFTIGQAMAKMHRVTESLILQRVTYNAKTLIEDSFNISRKFFGTDSEEMIFVNSTSKYLIAEYSKVKHEEVRSGAVHLDIWFDNLHFTNGNEVTIFDFDFCGNGWLCLDLAYYMVQLYNTRQSEDEYRRKLESFLAGYESIQKISAEEKRIIPMMAVSIWFFYLGVQCDRFDNWSNVFLSEDHLRRFIGIIKRWIEHHNLQIDARV
jgi:Ser/Thr protein kinase RdoA (MazF antagonist)